MMVIMFINNLTVLVSVIYLNMMVIVFINNLTVLVSVIYLNMMVIMFINNLTALVSYLSEHDGNNVYEQSNCMMYNVTV